jgi:hypothetical protein
VRTALVVLAALVLTGCGSGQEAAVEDAARSFDAALRTGAVSRACEDLAPSTRAELEGSTGQDCEQALPEQHLVVLERVGGVQRYGRQASVEVHGAADEADTWFLSRFDGRWLIVAASCRPRPELPYDCDVEGP